jgi:hypothetical protein
MTFPILTAPNSYGSYGTPTTLELAGRIAELEGGYRSPLVIASYNVYPVHV